MSGSILDRTPTSISLWGVKLPPPEDNAPKTYDVLRERLEESRAHYANTGGVMKKNADVKAESSDLMYKRRRRLSAAAEILLNEMPRKGVIENGAVHVAFERGDIYVMLKKQGYEASLATIASDIVGIGNRVHVRVYTADMAHYNSEKSTRRLKMLEEKEYRASGKMQQRNLASLL